MSANIQEEKMKLMLEAIRLSNDNMEAGKGGPFGCVVVKDGVIISRGYNQVTSTNDPTAHAEVVAIRDACDKLGSFQLTGCEIYTSCEPCPMCLGAIYWSRPDKVYYANTRADAAEIGFDDEFVYQQISTALDQRKIPFERISVPWAKEIFKKWQNKSDRILY